MAKSGAFKPEEHFRNLKGQDYLEVKWRMVWLNDENPGADPLKPGTRGADITTREVFHDPVGGVATFHARVEVFTYGPDGTRYVIKAGDGDGSETRADFAAGYYEKAACVPLNSRILTRRGFKLFDEVNVGEDVLAYDAETDTTRWTPLRQIQVYNQAEVIALTNKWGYRLECTPDHTWASRYSGGPGYNYFRMQEAQNINGADHIVLAAPAPGGDSPLTSEEAAIIGWLFTDGTIRRDKKGDASVGIITQSKPEQIEEIRALVGSQATLTVTPARTMTIANNPAPSECLPQHAFALPAAITRALLSKAGVQTDADLPALATRLSVEAREAMFGAMMRADGTARGRFGKKRRPGTMEAWRVLCALRGVATGALAIRQSGMPSQRARKTRHMMGSQLKKEGVGLRTVWCPSTDLGTWVMEQNGTVVVTGNTKAVGRAAALAGYGTQFAIELEEEEGTVVDAPVERKGARAALAMVPQPVDTEALRAQVEAGLAADTEAAARLSKGAAEMNAEELSKTLTWLTRRSRAQATP